MTIEYRKYRSTEEFTFPHMDSEDTHSKDLSCARFQFKALEIGYKIGIPVSYLRFIVYPREYALFYIGRKPSQKDFDFIVENSKNVAEEAKPELLKQYKNLVSRKGKECLL